LPGARGAGLDGVLFPARRDEGAREQVFADRGPDLREGRGVSG
jgi:hypothetical protein